MLVVVVRRIYCKSKIRWRAPAAFLLLDSEGCRTSWWATAKGFAKGTSAAEKVGPCGPRSESEPTFKLMSDAGASESPRSDRPDALVARKTEDRTLHEMLARMPKRRRVAADTPEGSSSPSPSLGSSDSDLDLSELATILNDAHGAENVATGDFASAAVHRIDGPGVEVIGLGLLPLPVGVPVAAALPQPASGTSANEWLIGPAGVRFENPAWRGGVPRKLLDEVSSAVSVPEGTTCMASLTGLLIAGPGGDLARAMPTDKNSPAGREGWASAAPPFLLSPCSPSLPPSPLLHMRALRWCSRTAVRLSRCHPAEQVGRGGAQGPTRPGFV